MLSKSLLSSLALSSLLCFELSGGLWSHRTTSENEPVQDSLSQDGAACDEKAPSPVRLSMRHIEAKGIGYQQGYTTLEGFVSLPNPWGRWLPFVDIRGHLFNNGKLAANGGLGLRYLAPSRVWGVNTYYDYRKTNHQNYHQVSLGLESLGKIWDFRLNGYLPVGTTSSSTFHTRFHGFKGNYGYLSSKYEFALKGANAEVGAHVDAWKNWPLYFAAGPYYLEGQGKATWGGEARVALDIFEYARIEANTSYDRLFKWNGQGQLSIIIPFGKKRQVKPRKGMSCSSAQFLATRAVQRVDRSEIIPVDRQHRKSKMINPATGEPYFFWFVDNQSHSAGTFESPFNTLAAAQNASSANDIIYVFPGDGTSTGMDEGITLKDNQKLWGTGIDQTLTTTKGTFQIPAMSSGMPLITGSLSPVITAANSNEIAGVHLLTRNDVVGFHGMECIDAAGIFVHDNVFDVAGTSGDTPNNTGLFLSCTGSVVVRNNTFNVLDNGLNKGLQIKNSTGSETTFVITNNIFAAPEGLSSATGIELGNNNPQTPIGDFASLLISQNQFIRLGKAGAGGKSIGGYGFGGTGSITITDNVFSQSGDGLIDGIRTTALIRLRAGGNLAIRASNNVWENSQNITFGSFSVVNEDVTSRACVTLENNTSDVNSADTAYYLSNLIGGSMTTHVANNVGTVTQLNTTEGTCP